MDADAPTMEVLHAVVPGRLRVALPGLKHHEALARALERAAQRLGGIATAHARAATGTLLVTHDQALTQEDACARIAEAWSIARGTQPAPETAWWASSSTEVAERLGAPLSGLTTASAAERRTHAGANRLPASPAVSTWRLLLGQFASLPTALLCASAAISLATGGVADALLIGGVVAMNAALGFVTEANAERIIGSFVRHEQMRATVQRDGIPLEIASEDVVPGDLLLLSPGAGVAADARLIEANDLTVDESLLTGESLPVAKSAERIDRTAPPLGERTNMVFAGTMTISGHGRALVVATGTATQLGQISAEIIGTARQSTPMQRQISRLGGQLTGLGVLSAAAMLGIGLARGLGFTALARTAVALAVAAIPEGITTVSTTVLASGLREMRRHDVLIRRLIAVETLGAVDTVCFDKTGTLTENRMAAAAFVINGQRLTLREGAFQHEGQPLDPPTRSRLLDLLRAAVLCNDSSLTSGGHTHVANGSSTETALLLAAIEAGLDIDELRRNYPLVGSAARRTERKRYMTTRHIGVDGTLVAVKGNPVDVLKLCRSYAGEQGPVSLDAARRSAILAENEQMTARGLRVLGFAHGEGANDLAWLGMIGLRDPVRPDMESVITSFHAAGIRTLMITGDQPGTARAVAEELHLAPQITVIDGGTQGFEGWMQENAESEVFARISPIQKLNIVRTLQERGHVVAMTGDGSNDGPALRAADIGVALGRNGTGLARDVADVVLASDDLQTMIVAVRQGRAIGANIRKAVRFLVGTNGSEVMLALGATLLGLGQPLSPAQLLWINLLTDVVIAYSLGFEPPEADAMTQPPRLRDAPVLGAHEYRHLALKSGLYSASALATHLYGLARYGGSGGGIGFSTLLGAQLLDGLSARSVTAPFWRLPANTTLQTSLLGLLGLQAAVSVLPASRRVLGLAAFSLLDLAVIAAGSLIPFLAVELSKPGAPAVTAARHVRDQVSMAETAVPPRDA